MDVTDINVGHIDKGAENQIVNDKASSLGLFTFKGFLNLGMLLTESPKAKN
ncbi:MAG: hypothetical protein WDM90_01250 [Ferruginibacter sp.]